jgi:signal transduction histidine kinase
MLTEKHAIMNYKQLNSPSKLRPVENAVNGKKRSSGFSGPVGIEVDTNKASENYYMLQLKELKERNVHSEELVKQLGEKLIEVVTTNSKFISVIAHDLRSPFHSILGALELVRIKLEDHHYEDDLENYINMAANSAIRTLKLLDELLDWTLSQNAEKSFNPVKINLYELVMTEIVSIGFAAEQKNISLNHSITNNLSVAADIQMIKTVLRNLIGNAIKYTNIGGNVSISASESGQFVEIAVRDNGVGISQEAQKRLFKIDTFHSTPGTDNEKGTGLGLILCKEFIEMHGGKIRIESEPGKGSKFMFSLPHYI